MGYILPVNHYQYNDYHTRVIQEKRRGTKQVDRSFKVILDKKHENLRHEYQRLQYKPTLLSPEKGKGEKFHVRI